MFLHSKTIQFRKIIHETDVPPAAVFSVINAKTQPHPKTTKQYSSIFKLMANDYQDVTQRQKKEVQNKGSLTNNWFDILFYTLLTVEVY